MSNYFSHPFVSNSDLSRLKVELGTQEEPDYSEALRFGTLVHALILEPHTVDLIRRQVVGAGYTYTQEELNTARKMRTSFLADSFCASLLANCETEVEMYNAGTRFSHQGVEFTLDTRRKYDLWSAVAGWGGDLKSTTATTQAGFEAAIDRFHYDRARVFYAAGPGAVQDCIIGISKVAPYRVFKVFMKSGDRLWQSGERKMQELAFKYWSIKAPQTV